MTARRSAGPGRCSVSTHSAISSALPTRGPQRRVHRGDERLGAHAVRGADRHQRSRQRSRIGRSSFMNAPLPHLTSSTRALLPSASFLLITDAEISGMLSIVRGDVAQRVELLVGGGDVGGLADEAAAHLAQGGAELVQGQRHAEPGNRLELVERAAGVPEPAARHLRHDDAAGGGQRRQHDRHLVADAAGAVLADLDAGNRGQVDPPCPSAPSRRSATPFPRRSCRAARWPSAAPTPGNPATIRRSRRRRRRRSRRGRGRRRRAWRG